jgi:hypothetical protein
MARVIYRGSPGYEVCPIGAPSFVPVPGETYDVDDDLVASLGPDFEPVDGPRVFDPGRATKAELAAWADAHGLDLDRTASVADQRAAVQAAIDSGAPAGDTTTGQEG